MLQNGCKKDTKAVIIISNPVIGPVRTVLKDIITNSYFEHCTLIIGCSPSVQTFAQIRAISDPSDEVTIFQKLKQEVLLWMGTKVFLFCNYLYISHTCTHKDSVNTKPLTYLPEHLF